MKRIFVIICLSMVILTCFSGCVSVKEYNKDIKYKLDDDESIIIREYMLFRLTAAELYYEKEGEKPIFLGETSGADEVLCPFKEGLYEISHNKEDNTIVVSWCFKDLDRSKWRSKTFELPCD